MCTTALKKTKRFSAHIPVTESIRFIVFLRHLRMQRSGGHGAMPTAQQEYHNQDDHDNHANHDNQGTQEGRRAVLQVLQAVRERVASRAPELTERVGLCAALVGMLSHGEEIAEALFSRTAHRRLCCAGESGNGIVGAKPKAKSQAYRDLRLTIAEWQVLVNASRVNDADGRKMSIKEVGEFRAAFRDQVESDAVGRRLVDRVAVALKNTLQEPAYAQLWCAPVTRAMAVVVVHADALDVIPAMQVVIGGPLHVSDSRRLENLAMALEDDAAESLLLGSMAQLLADYVLAC